MHVIKPTNLAKHITILSKRKDWLNARLAIRAASNQKLSRFDLQETKALGYAIRQLNLIYKEMTGENCANNRLEGTNSRSDADGVGKIPQPTR